MKAWTVSSRNPIEGGSVVVFAETASKAKYAGLAQISEMGEADEYADVSARRFPAMDGREDNPPTLQELVEEHGWGAQCCGCECPIDADGALIEDEDGEDIYIAVYWNGMMAQCAGCADGGA